MNAWPKLSCTSVSVAAAAVARRRMGGTGARGVRTAPGRGGAMVMPVRVRMVWLVCARGTLPSRREGSRAERGGLG